MQNFTTTTNRPQTAQPAPVAELTGYDAGFAAYWQNKKRSTLTFEEQIGYDDARGQYCYHMAMLAEVRS